MGITSFPTITSLFGSPPCASLERWEYNAVNTECNVPRSALSVPRYHAARIANLKVISPFPPSGTYRGSSAIPKSRILSAWVPEIFDFIHLSIAIVHFFLTLAFSLFKRGNRFIALCTSALSASVESPRLKCKGAMILTFSGIEGCSFIKKPPSNRNSNWEVENEG